MQSGRFPIASIAGVALTAVAVVIVIWPALAPREDHGRPPMCQSNLKQCVQALRMYSDDYDGQMPSSYLVSHSRQWSRRDATTFIARLGSQYPPVQGRKHTWAQVLYDNMKNKDVMFCTADQTDHAASPTTQTSYIYKLANDKAWYGIGCLKPRRLYSDYAHPGDQIAFYERLGWHFGDTKGLHNGVQINVSFMDTHAEVIVVRNATSGDPLNCAANTDGEPMYYNCSAESKHGYERTQTGPATLTDPASSFDKL